MKTVKYDLSFWVKSDKSIEEAQQIFETIKGKITSQGFNIEKALNPILKEMSYMVNKDSQAYLCSMVFTLNGEADLKFFKELFKFDTNILRFMVTLAPDNINMRRIRKSRINKEAKPVLEGKVEEKVESEAKEEVAIENVETEEKDNEEVVETAMVEEETINQDKINLDTLDEKLDELLK